MERGFKVDIHREESRLKKQVACLMHQQLLRNFKKNRYFVLLLVISTIISTVLVLTLKDRVAVGVSGWFLFFTAFLWLGAIVFGGTALLNYVSGKRLTKRSVEEYLALVPNSSLQADNESISYITGDNKLTYTWSAITEWFEKEGTLFLVPEQQILKAFYFSKEDIGETAYAQLRSLASTQVR
jgi:hypothetical protein